MAKFSLVLTHAVGGNNQVEVEIDGDLDYVLRKLRETGAISARAVAGGRAGGEIAFLREHIVAIEPV